MLLTLNKKDKKDALEIFKYVLVYMGDRSNKTKLTPDGIALEIGPRSCTPSKNSLCRSVQMLVQQGPPRRNIRAALQADDQQQHHVCASARVGTQLTTGSVSCLKGWELMWICLNFFPPSSKFFSYVQGAVTCIAARLLMARRVY